MFHQPIMRHCVMKKLSGLQSNLFYSYIRMMTFSFWRSPLRLLTWKSYSREISRYSQRESSEFCKTYRWDVNCCRKYSSWIFFLQQLFSSFWINNKRCIRFEKVSVKRHNCLHDVRSNFTLLQLLRKICLMEILLGTQGVSLLIKLKTLWNLRSRKTTKSALTTLRSFYAWFE